MATKPKPVQGQPLRSTGGGPGIPPNYITPIIGQLQVIIQTLSQLVAEHQPAKKPPR